VRSRPSVLWTVISSLVALLVTVTGASPAKAAAPQCSRVASSQVTASVTADGKASFTWKPVPGVEQYFTDLSLSEIIGNPNGARDNGGSTSLVAPFVIDGKDVSYLHISVYAGCLDAAGTSQRTVVGTAFLNNAPTRASTPAQPESPVATLSGRTVTLTWQVPARDGGKPIIQYVVTSQPGRRTCRTSGALTCSFSNLKVGTLYTFQVQARNAAGLGPATPVQMQIPAAPKPLAGLS